MSLTLWLVESSDKSEMEVEESKRKAKKGHAYESEIKGLTLEDLLENSRQVREHEEQMAKKLKETE